MFFVFQHLDMFWGDLTSFYAPFAILFFIGILFVCFYIFYTISRIEDKNYISSERFDLIYKIVFSCVMLFVALRAIFTGSTDAFPIGPMIAAVVVGVLNWFIPAITTNSDNEF